MKYAKIVVFVLVVNFLFCSTNNIYDANDGDGKLVIKTDKSVYSWQQGESDLWLTIGGTVKNNSSVTYYSNAGDGFGPAEQSELLFAANSAGVLEKYNAANNTWNKIEMFGFLIEGSRFIPVKAFAEYTFHASPHIDTETTEQGIYRLKLAYFDKSDPDEQDMPYYDYSNSFKINH